MATAPKTIFGAFTDECLTCLQLWGMKIFNTRILLLILRYDLLNTGTFFLVPTMLCFSWVSFMV